MNKLNKQIKNLIIFLLLVINTILISSIFYKKHNRQPLIVQVLNGCGKEGAAADIAGHLKNVTIISVENADQFDYEESVIIVWRKGKNKELKSFYRTVGITQDHISFKSDDLYPADVSLIVGHDHPTLKNRLTTPTQK
ncbi:LytR C-terminal domain-containing protein [candidate division KSB1 bacterium]|nr:LytR C-terminal domain-containing protein [candidate division KSB1 bacterium]